MNVTIIGTGNMGRALATRVLAGGHDLTLLGTSAAKAEALAGELEGSVDTGAVDDALEGDVVILAVWYPTTLEVVERYADQLQGKVVVDISNPIDVEAFEPLTLAAGSGAEEAAARAPGARVVKAFNTTFARTLAAGNVEGKPVDVFVASDDDEAKQTVIRLVEDSGLRAVDAGPLRRARELEAAGFLHMAVQGQLGTGFGSALKVIG
jgi:8-hydroxy-5-deazaflavin:NADPH oxidoreductase